MSSNQVFVGRNYVFTCFKRFCDESTSWLDTSHQFDNDLNLVIVKDFVNICDKIVVVTCSDKTIFFLVIFNQNLRNFELVTWGCKNLFTIFLQKERNTASYCTKAKQSNFNRHLRFLLKNIHFFNCTIFLSELTEYCCHLRSTVFFFTENPVHFQPIFVRIIARPIRKGIQWLLKRKNQLKPIEKNWTFFCFY